MLLTLPLAIICIQIHSNSTRIDETALAATPIRDFDDTDIRLQPIGLCYRKAAVKKQLPEIEVVIRDFHQGRGRTTIPLPGALADLRSDYLHPDRSPFSTFYQHYHFGAPFAAIAARVGISALFFRVWEQMDKIATQQGNSILSLHLENR